MEQPNRSIKISSPRISRQSRTKASERKMNKELERLQAYPFQKLADLLEGTSTKSKDEPIALTIGEPKHSPPDFVLKFFQDPSKLSEALGAYPATRGLKSLRDSVAQFLGKHTI